MTHFIQQGHTYSVSSSSTPWASIFKQPKRENTKIALRTCYRKNFLVKGLESQIRMETFHYCWTRSVAWLRDQPQDELTLNHAFVVTCHNNNSLSLETSNAQPMASNVEKKYNKGDCEKQVFLLKVSNLTRPVYPEPFLPAHTLYSSSQLYQILKSRTHQ